MTAPTSTNRDPIDWGFWRLRAYVKDWEAAALSVGLNPDAMQHHPQAWMAGTGKPIFTAKSFVSSDQEREFSKRYRLVVDWVRSHGDHVRHFNGNEVSLRGFARWVIEAGLSVPLEFKSTIADDDVADGQALQTPSKTGKSPPAELSDATDVMTAQKGNNPRDVWVPEAHRVADQLHLADNKAGAHSSLADIADRVAKDFRQRGIRGPKVPLAGGTILREALQGGKWRRPD